MYEQRKKKHHLFSIKEMKTIQQKIITLTVSSLFITILIVTIISSVVNYQGTISTLETVLKETAQIAAENLENSINFKLEILEEFASREYFKLDAKTPQEITKYTKDFVKRQNLVSAVYVNANGKTIDGQDISNLEYFMQCKNTKKSQISDLIVDKVSKTVTMIFIAPIVIDGIFDGAILAVEDGQFLSNITNDITIGDTGTAFVINKEGVMMAYQELDVLLDQTNYIEKSKTDSSLAKLAAAQQKMIDGQNGFARYPYYGKEKMMSYAPLSINGWSIGITGEPQEYLDGTIFSTFGIIAVSILCIAISIWINRRMIRAIVKPLRLCADRMHLLGTGDLNSSFPDIDSKDEVATIAHAAQLVIQSLQDVILDIDTHLGNMASGDFSHTVTKEYNKDFNPIRNSLEKILYSLNTTLKSIYQCSNMVAAGAENLASASQSLATGATEQASAVQEVTAMIETVSNQANENAAIAKDAISVSNTAGSALQSGVEKMDLMVNAMSDISDVSLEIQNILTSIESIASQTNILALNASIEAARAGEAGRGFIVIAENVGKLAINSSKSAKNTRELINKTITLVNNGNQVASETKTVIQNVAAAAQHSIVLIEHIAEASFQQTVAMEEVSKGMEQISSIIQNNAAAAEETSATGDELTAQTTNLDSLVSEFKLLD